MFVWDATELNPEQSAAVKEPSSVILVACPSSGKTRTLTYKIAYELSRRKDKRRRRHHLYTHDPKRIRNFVLKEGWFSDEETFVGVPTSKAGLG